MLRKYELLVVDDNPVFLMDAASLLCAQGFEVATTTNGSQAMEMLASRLFDLVLTDLVLQDGNGLTVIQKSKETNPSGRVMVITGHPDIDSAVGALQLDADDYVIKPCPGDELLERVHRCLGKLEHRRQVDVFDGLVPVCCVCKKVRDDTGRPQGEGQWMPVENFLWNRMHLKVTSTYCADCISRVLDDIED